MDGNHVDIENSEVTILVEIDGKVHLIAMHKDRLEAISALVKRSTEFVVPTGKSQGELREFLSPNKVL